PGERDRGEPEVREWRWFPAAQPRARRKAVVGGGGNAGARVPEGVLDAVSGSKPRGPVDGEADGPSPGELDSDARELGVDPDHPPVQVIACAGDGGRREAGPSAEQHPRPVGYESPVRQKVLRVEEHAATRRELLRERRLERFGRDDVAADR